MAKTPAKGGGKAPAKGGKAPAKGGAAKTPAKATGGKKAAAGGSGGNREVNIATASAEALASPKDYAPRLKKFYDEVVRPQLIEEFGYKNPFEVPTIDKIVLNMGVGEAVNDTKKVTLAAADLSLIAGQKPVVTHARKAIAYLQGAREHADRRQGHFAQDPHVRVSRSARDDRPCRASATFAG